MKYHFIECPVCKFERREKEGFTGLCPVCNDLTNYLKEKELEK